MRRVALALCALVVATSAHAEDKRKVAVLEYRAGSRGMPDLGARLVHISTDFVFDGKASRPYAPADAPAPLGAYGASKLAGERLVMEASGGAAVIVRTAWVYSAHGGNFVKTMLRLARDRDEIAVVADQIGNPTSALDIAAGLVAIAENMVGSSKPEYRGTFHMTASGSASWAEFAEAIFSASQRLGGPTARVRQIATSDYPTPARRPPNSRLDCAKLERTHGVRLPHWKASVERIVERLLSDHDQQQGNV